MERTDLEEFGLPESLSPEFGRTWLAERQTDWAIFACQCNNHCGSDLRVSRNPSGSDRRSKKDRQADKQTDSGSLTNAGLRTRLRRVAPKSPTS